MGALCSAPHSPNSFPTLAARSSPSRVAVEGFTAGFHLGKYQGQWLGVCTGVWELVSLPKVDMKPLWLAALTMSDFLQVSLLAPCFLTGASFMAQVYPT